jgi:predicted nucleic acid-binding protein
MGQEYLIDTNVISHLFADRLPEKGKEFVTTIINTNFIISVVVEIEALTYHDTPDKMPLIEEFINMATILQLNSPITKKAIEMRRKHRKLKLGDAIIGATAIIHNLVLITNNVKDFANIKDLKIVDPHSL